MNTEMSLPPEMIPKDVKDVLLNGLSPDIDIPAGNEKPTAAIGKIFRDELDWIRNSSSFTVEQITAANAIALCKTPALGTSVEYCPKCKKVVNVTYFACNNRNCPNCQYPLQEKWIQLRKSEVIPNVPYFHIVMTLPHELNDLVFHNRNDLLNLLFRSSAQAVIEMCEDPKRLGAKPGIISVLHTWTQDLLPHYHIHMICSGGGLNKEGKFVALNQLYNNEADHDTAPESESDPSVSDSQSELLHDLINEETEVNAETAGKTPLGNCQNEGIGDRKKEGSFFLPLKALSSLFRGKFMAGLNELYSNHELTIPSQLEHLNNPHEWSTFCSSLYAAKWVGFIARTFEQQQGNAIDYLARYTFRTAISNSRILDYDGKIVTFQVRSKDNPLEKEEKKLTVHEFISRFLYHILPKGFTRVRFFGILANCRKTRNLETIHQQLLRKHYTVSPLRNLKMQDLMQALFPDRKDSCCPHCGSQLVLFTTNDLFPDRCRKSNRLRASPASKKIA